MGRGVEVWGCVLGVDLGECVLVGVCIGLGLGGLGCLGGGGFLDCLCCFLGGAGGSEAIIAVGG